MMHTRWQITGTFTTTSPLHVGSGNITTNQLLINDKNKDHREVQSVVKDWKGKPCIPGTALKGVLRAWADQFFKDDPRINRIFGLKDMNSKSAESDWAEFCTVKYKALGATITLLMSHIGIPELTPASQVMSALIEKPARPRKANSSLKSSSLRV